MALADYRILAAGAALLAAGLAASAYLAAEAPAGRAGMTDEEVAELAALEAENSGARTLAGIVAGAGLLLALVSFGAARRPGRRPAGGAPRRV